MKPWVTSGRQRSVEIKEKIYNQMIKLKTKRNKRAQFEACDQQTIFLPKYFRTKQEQFNNFMASDKL